MSCANDQKDTERTDPYEVVFAADEKTSIVVLDGEAVVFPWNNVDLVAPRKLSCEEILSRYQLSIDQLKTLNYSENMRIFHILEFVSKTIVECDDVDYYCVLLSNLNDKLTEENVHTISSVRDFSSLKFGKYYVLASGPINMGQTLDTVFVNSLEFDFIIDIK